LKWALFGSAEHGETGFSGKNILGESDFTARIQVMSVEKRTTIVWKNIMKLECKDRGFD